MTAGAVGLRIVFGGLIYVAALVALLPAAWLARQVERASEEMVVLRDPVGSLWSGSAALHIREPRSGALELGRLGWRTSPSGLLNGRLDADLTLGESPTTTRVEWSPGTFAVRRVSFEFPASVLGGFAQELDVLGPQGKIVVNSSEFRLERGEVHGLANVEWRSMRLARGPDLDLGSHVARLRGDAGKVSFDLSTTRGPVRVSGRGSWTQATGLRVSGSVVHGEDRTPALAPFLRGVCSAYADRRCEFRIPQ